MRSVVWLDRLSGACSLKLGRPSREAGSGVLALGALAAVLALTAGCGNQYRPVVTPINPTGPSGQQTAYITTFSQPGFTPTAAGSSTPCAGGTYSTRSVITLLDFSGDTILDQAQGGYGPLTFSLESSGAQVFSPNCDGTVTTSNNSSGSILTKNVQTSTLLPGSDPTNTLYADNSLYVTEVGLHGPDCLSTNCVAQMTGYPASLKQEIPVAPSVINLVGFNTAQRIYAISQGTTGSGVAWGDCDTPASVTTDGEADAIETSTNTISAKLTLGVCPVYGVMSPDTLRTFVMNRGSSNVTVINSQLNALDTTNPNLGANGTIAVGGGPVYADYYENGQELVTANYDSSTISIIDVSTDVYGNDSATFGTVLKTIDLTKGPGCPTGADTYCMHPVEDSVLQDGSRVYVANQGDIAAGIPGSVEVVNLQNYTIEKVIPLPAGFYPHAIGSVYAIPYGKVYVSSQYSPYLYVIRTDTDTITDTPEMQGDIVDMHVNAQYPAQSKSNYQTQSRAVGSGAP